ncbi:MAG: glycosyltransferase family 2 protein [Phycisphaerae bacterium]
MSDSSLDQAHAEPAGAVVSVVIPSYRSGAIVGEAIDSVLAQTRAADEIIVVDDGSPAGDETAAVCARFNGRVRYIRQENQRASVARNTGITASKGGWLAFLDADDRWDPEKLELQLAALARHPEADFCVTASLAWSASDGSYRLYRWEGPADPEVMRSELLVRNIFTGACSSLLTRRQALEAVGCFPPGKGSEDRRVVLRLLERHRAVLIDVPLVRQQPGPAHWSDPEWQRAEMLSLIEDHATLYSRMDATGLLKRRALAKVHDRAGMHYLENGDWRAASRDLTRAAVLWPLLPNPWRVLINTCLGRLPSRAARTGRA